MLQDKFLNDSMLLSDYFQINDIKSCKQINYPHKYQDNPDRDKLFKRLFGNLVIHPFFKIAGNIVCLSQRSAACLKPSEKVGYGWIILLSFLSGMFL